MPARDWITAFSSGYMQRVMHQFPRQGDKAPWINTQNYAEDRKLLRNQEIDDGILTFTNPAAESNEANSAHRESDAA